MIKLDFATRDENFDFGNLATSRLLANSKDEYAAYHIAELVLQETNRTALLICATTSLINEIVRTPTARLSRGCLVTFLPKEQDCVATFSNTHIQEQFPIDAYRCLRDFESRLKTACAMTIEFSRPSNNKVQGIVHDEILANFWCDLCETAMALIRAVKRALGDGLPQIIANTASHALQLLAPCANGGSPCLKIDGTVEIPGFIERRKKLRYVVDWPATLLLGSHDADVEITNISAGGLNMLTNAALGISDGITVELSNGRRLRGKVAWSSYHDYGIEFATPLCVSDELLHEAANSRMAGALAIDEVLKIGTPIADKIASSKDVVS